MSSPLSTAVQLLPSRLPSARTFGGAGHRPGAPRQADLDRRSGGWRPGAMVCSARPGRRRAGWKCDQPRTGIRVRILAIPEPECPAGGAVSLARTARDLGVADDARGDHGCAPSSPAGCRPPQTLSALSILGGPRAFALRASRRAYGVTHRRAQRQRRARAQSAARAARFGPP